MQLVSIDHKRNRRDDTGPASIDRASKLPSDQQNSTERCHATSDGLPDEVRSVPLSFPYRPTHYAEALLARVALMAILEVAPYHKLGPSQSSSN